MKHLIKMWILVAAVLAVSTANAQIPERVIDIAWNADGTLIAVSLNTGTIEVRSATAHEVIWSSVEDWAPSIDWHPTIATELAYVPPRGPITVVDVMSDTQLSQIPVDGRTYSIAYDPTGARLLISHTNAETGPDQEGFIRVFDRATGQETTTYESVGWYIDPVTGQETIINRSARYIGSAKWDNTGQRILALSDFRLVIWDATSGQIIQTISELELGTDDEGYTYEVGQMTAFDLNQINNNLVIAKPTGIIFWDAPNYAVKRLEELTFGPIDLEWSTDGNLVATAVGRNYVSIIDPMTGHILNKIETSQNINVLAWHPVTSELAIGEITPTGGPLIVPVH